MPHGEVELLKSHCDWIAGVRAEYERLVVQAGEDSLDRRLGAYSARPH